MKEKFLKLFLGQLSPLETSYFELMCPKHCRSSKKKASL